MLFLKGEVFLSKETDDNRDNGDNHLGWSRVDTTDFYEKF